MVIIGLTGGSGVGKGEACAVFKALGCGIIDADASYRELCVTCKPMLAEITASFGDVLNENGALNRKKLGAVVFSDPQKLALLNRITHPYIRASARQQFGNFSALGVPACIYDAPTLFEADADALCDVTVAVLADRNLRITRICARDKIDESYASLRIDAQKSDDWYKAHCDYVITNNADLRSLEKQVREVFQKIINKE